MSHESKEKKSGWMTPVAIVIWQEFTVEAMMTRFSPQPDEALDPTALDASVHSRGLRHTLGPRTCRPEYRVHAIVSC
jgi:hypothetical protein